MREAKLACRYCPDEYRCNAGMHRATLRVRAWLKERLMLAIEPYQVGKRNVAPSEPIGEAPADQEHSR